MDLKSIISKLEELDHRHVTAEQETQSRIQNLENENHDLKSKIHKMEMANMKLKKDCDHLKIAMQNIGQLAHNMNGSHEHPISTSVGDKNDIEEVKSLDGEKHLDIVNDLSMDSPRIADKNEPLSIFGTGDGVQQSEVFLSFKCHICDSRRFSSLVDLQEHQIHEHPDYGFICSHAWCPEIFKHKGHMLQHERMHCSPNDNDLEECPINNCSVIFNRRWTSYHTKLFHSDDNIES